MQHHDIEKGGHMKLIEIEHYRDDLPGALAQAKADIPILEQAFKDAETKLAAAEAERQRWQKNYGRFVSAIPVLREKAKDAKRRCMALEADGGDAASGWNGWRRITNELEQSISTFSWLSLYPQPDADRAFLVAQIEERTAYAALLDGQAARARAGALEAVAKAHAFDPGLEVKFSKSEDGGTGSWSNAESQRAHEIMTREIPSLREMLAAHDAQVAQQRSDMNNSIWN
jgi:hypothetical protein